MCDDWEFNLIKHNVEVLEHGLVEWVKKNM